MATFIPQIVIIEFGGQLTQNIGRVIRKANVRPVILAPDKAEQWLEHHQVKGIILSGSGKSVNDKNAPRVAPWVLELHRRGIYVPILGICYGMQYLAKHYGGQVASVAGNKEYGEAQIELTERTVLFKDTPLTQKVWTSHGDSVISTGNLFSQTAKTSSGGIGAMHSIKRSIHAVQFHPEATQTEYGAKILHNFLYEVCGCKKDWEPSSVIDEIRAEAENEVGKGRVSLPFSGGVDSTVTAAILAPVFKNRIQGYTIDADQLRLNEGQQIETHARVAQLPWKMIDAREEFVRAVSMTIKAPEKRRIFGHFYNRHLNQQAVDFGATHVVQGTLAPDLIESGKTGGDIIVQHHNTGMVFPAGVSSLEPLRNLFKFEVRELGQTLSLPESVSQRQPFPGPGLFLRVIGVPVSHQLLELVRWIDTIVVEIMKKTGDYDRCAQLVAAFGGLTVCGVKGDAPSYGCEALIRGIETLDFMTGRGVYFSEAAVRECTSVLTKNPLLQRAWFDYTDKPPGRTEFE